MTGAGNFVDDMRLPGMVEVALVRSPHAHARIRGIDATRARSAPGVVTVVTGTDVAGTMRPVPCIWTLPDMKAPTRQAITADKARFAGDIVAAVVASDLATAEDAVDLVQVDYEVLPAVVDQEAAMRPGAPLLHDDVPDNTAFTWKLEAGDQSMFDTAPVKARVRLVNQRLIPNPMEGRAVLAQWSPPTGELTVWTSTQIPHLVKLQLARVLDLPEHKIRVIAPDVGGGFGAKQNFYPEEMLIAALAVRLRRPVKWVEQRRENFVAMTHGRDHIQDAEIVGQRDGTISGIRVTSRANVGAYFSMFAPAVPTGLFGLMLSGCYRLPTVSCQVYGVLTNTTTVDAYRGAGRPEAAHLVERLVSMFAAELGMDPGGGAAQELRRARAVPVHDDHRGHLRQRQLRGGARPGPRAGGIQGAAPPAGRGAPGRSPPGHRRLLVRGDLWHRALAGAGGGRGRPRRVGVEHGARASHGQGHGADRLIGARPGTRDLVRPDRGRRARPPHGRRGGDPRRHGAGPAGHRHLREPQRRRGRERPAS